MLDFASEASHTREMKSISPTLNLEITKEIYDRAVRANSHACIIADAIKEQYPEFSSVDVNIATTRVSDRKRGERYIYLTPTSAGEQVLAFDQGWIQPEKSFPIKVRYRNAVKILPIARSLSDIKLKAERKAKRQMELELKQKSGETLTTDEKIALTLIQKPKTSPERPTVYGAAEVVADKPEGVVVRGGREWKRKDSRLQKNLLHGTDRHFGAKQAQPSQVFKEAVDTAVKAAVKADRAKRKGKESK